jgi:2-polyprenyl-3-methyl-5-hydroxy-6-metoxy-1,4-benzoquinol methylase
MDDQWPIRLFNKSVLKQNKFKQIIQLLGPTDGLACLDIGSDNGVISYLFRQRGGTWKTADLDQQSVDAIKALVKSEVYHIDGKQTPFDDAEFDRVIIVDFLEHIPNDAEFMQELHRILKPEGTIIVNVPHVKNGLLRRFRSAIGQTDEKHGHLRAGYTIQSLNRLFADEFIPERCTTYSKFFSELIDALIVFAVSVLKGKRQQQSKKGILVSENDLRQNQSMFRIYSLIYPMVWLFSQLDRFLFFTDGYMLIARAAVKKET